MKENAKELACYAVKSAEENEFQIKHKTSKRHFIRKSPLGFKNTSLIILNLIRKSLRAEVMDYFYSVDKNAKAPSRQAFSEAREKISYLAFKDFAEKSFELTVNSKTARLYKGYRLFGVDSTSFAVGELEKLSEYFGESTTIAGKAMCRISAVVDIPNECIAHAVVSPFSVGERALAIEQAGLLKEVSNALYLFDRGYWSPELVEAIIGRGQKFLMRLASNSGNREIEANYGLRRYSFMQPNGITEILLTNLSESEVPDEELGALYSKRWGAETKYLELKDRLQINSLSGESVNTVLQDIYSTLYISNLTAFICWEADEKLREQNSAKNNKYGQKVNRSLCISTLRTRFIDICLLPKASSRAKGIRKIADDIKRDVVYINKSKSRPRNKRALKQSRRCKHSKSVL